VVFTAQLKVGAEKVLDGGMRYAIAPDMPFPSCPVCGAMAPSELEASKVAHVNYYRCGECAHVWTADKRTHAILTHITPLPPKGGDPESNEA